MASNRSWAYESRRERIRRQREIFSRAASDAMARLQQGDISGARTVLRGEPATAPQLTQGQMAETSQNEVSSALQGAAGKVYGGARQKLGENPAILSAAGQALTGTRRLADMQGNPQPDDVFSKIGRGIDAVTPGFAEPATHAAGKYIGRGLTETLEALDKPRQYVPLLSWAMGTTGIEPEVDPNTGLTYRGKPSLRDWARGIGETFTRSPIESYNEARRAQDERLNDPNLKPGDRVLLSMFQDPLILVGAGAVSKGLKLAGAGRAGRAVQAANTAGKGATLGQRFINFGTGALESPGKATLGAALGSSLAAEGAARAGASPREQSLLTLAGGIGGGIASNYATLDNARAAGRGYNSTIDAISEAEDRALRKVLTPQGSLASESGQFSMGRPKVEDPYKVNIPPELDEAIKRSGKTLDSITEMEFLDIEANLNTAAARGEGSRIARALLSEDDLPTAMRRYGQDFKYENPKLVAKFANVRPDDEVMLYRAIAANDPNAAIRPGDWVAIEPSYAELHGSGGYGDTGSRVISQKVKARDVAWAGTDANEWIYAPVALRNPNATPLDVMRKAVKDIAPDAPYEGRRVIPDSKTFTAIDQLGDIERREDGVLFRRILDGAGSDTGKRIYQHPGDGYWIGVDGETYDTAQDALNAALGRPLTGATSDALDSAPRPLANERLWFHSTRDMSYDIPDEAKAVGTAWGITQGPGVYLAADPAKSAGRYGNRTFVTEFDGNVLDLTRKMGPDDPLFDGGPTWNDVAERIVTKLEASRAKMADLSGRLDSHVKKTASGWETPDGKLFGRKESAIQHVGDLRRQPAMLDAKIDLIRRAIRDTEYLKKMQEGAWSLVARNADDVTGYAYRDALAKNIHQVVSRKDLDQWLGRFSALGKDGEFGAYARLDDDKVGLSVINATLADMGVDAVFHHSPRADGDVLIVLNGEKARVLGDVRNAPDVVTKGKTWAEMKGGAPAPGSEEYTLRVVNERNAYIKDSSGKTVRSLHPDEDTKRWPWGTRTPEEAFEAWKRENAPSMAEYGSAVADFRPSAEGLAIVANALKMVEPTHLISSMYGKLPFLRKQGIGQAPSWLNNAPDAYSTDSLIPLKEVLQQDPNLPASARISNRFWKTLSAFNPNFKTKLDDARVRQIGVAYRIADRELIPQVADVISQVYAAPAGLQVDELGRALVDGAPVQYMARRADGSVMPVAQRQAGWADILERPSLYPEAINSLSPEQMDALRGLSAKLQDIQDTSRAMGINIEGEVVPDPDGFYFPRGRPGHALREDTPVSYRGARYEGRRAGSTKERLFESQSQGIARGRAYPDPVEAVRTYVSENLKQQNAVHAANQLKQLEVGDGKLGASMVPEATARELTQIRGELRPAQRAMSKLKREKFHADRAVRLEARTQQQLSKRFGELREQVVNASAEGETRRAAAAEAFTMARQQLDDHLSAARELADKTASTVSTRDASARELRSALDEATALSKRLDEVEDELNVARDRSEMATDVARLGNLPTATYREAEAAWRAAERVKALAVKEAARIERMLGGVAMVEESTRGRYTDALEQARYTRQLFGEELSSAGASAREMSDLAAREARAAANVREKLAEGKAFELNRIASSRANYAREIVGRQTKLGLKIQELAEQIGPMKERRQALLAQVAEVRKLARMRESRFAGEVNLEPLRGVAVPADIANAFNKYLSSAGPRGSGTAIFDLINNLFRSIGATADASRQMTVGLLGQSDRPDLAARGVRAGIKAMRDPQSMWRELDSIQKRYAAKGIDLPLEEAVGKHGLQISASESTLAGVAKRGTVEERMANLPLIKQSEALYSAPSNIERVERFYATLARRKAAGQDWTSPQARNAAANIANLVSGRARRGIFSPFVGEEVSGRLAFAGRFVESQFEVVANAILTGGIEGDEARRALLRLGMGGAALTYAINEALGNETDWNPDSGNFMRIRVAGRDFSLFGPWDSLAKGVYGMGRDAWAAADNIPGVPGNLEYEGRAERFGRGKLGPIAAIGYDLTRGGGENPVGEPLSVQSVAPVPFGLRDITETALGTNFSDPTAIGAFGLAAASAVLGIKNSPLTPTEKLDEAARDLIDPATGKPNGKRFYDSPPSVQKMVKEQYPKLWEEKVAKGTKLQQDAEEIKTRYRDEQQSRDRKLLSGQITLQQWRNARDEAYSRRSGEMAQLYKDIDFPERSDVLSKYYDVMERATEDGIFNSAMRDEYLDSLSEADRKYIEDNTGLYATSLERVYRDLSKQYYELPRYMGYTSDEARQIDELWQEVRNNAGSTDELQLTLAMRKMPLDGYSEKVQKGVRRRIWGMLITSQKRSSFAAANPGIVLINGEGKLTPEMADSLIGLLQKAA